MSRANFKLSFSERKLSPEIEPLAISKLSLSAKELGPEPKYSHIRPLLAAAPPFIADYFLQKSERYYDGFRISFFSHFLVLILTIVKMAFFPTQSLTYFPSLRVDMVGLPDILKKDLENISKNSPAKKQIEEALKKADLEIAKLKIEKKNSKNPEEIVPKDEMAIKTAAKAREKKLKNAIDRIKALSKIQKQTHPEDPQLPEDPDLLEDAGKRSAVIKGNRLSKGSSLTAEARESEQVSYLESVRSKLHENWLLPVFLQRQNFSAQVKLFIDSRGKIIRAVFVKPSGNQRFDSEVELAIQNSQPLPHPPSHLSDQLRYQGIDFGFPL